MSRLHSIQAPFNVEDDFEVPFGYDGQNLDEMVHIGYGSLPVQMDHLKDPNGQHPYKENTTIPGQYLGVESPRTYDPSSGVSSPGSSDNNVDTFSATSLDDRNEFDHLIDYDGGSSVDGGEATSVKPEVHAPSYATSGQEEGDMSIFGRMDWSAGFDESTVFPGFAETSMGPSPTIWNDVRSPEFQLSPESQSFSPRQADTRPMSAASGLTPAADRMSVPPEAAFFHAEMYGRSPATSDPKFSMAQVEKEEVKTDGMAGLELETREDFGSRKYDNGKGKRKSPSQDWESSYTQDQLAQKRLQAASLENQSQIPQTIPLDTPGSRKKTLNLTKHLSDQPFIPLPLPFGDPSDIPSGYGGMTRASARLLFINCEFPIKSRVETQTTLRIIVSNLPEGVKKLHMPRHTISRPKQMLKEPHIPSPDTLELDCYVACETAWRKCPERLVRDAFRKACNEPEEPNPNIKLRKFDEDEDDKPNTRERGPSIVETSLTDPKNPLNGGEVYVCAGCMDREGKRSTRKKVKRPKEEQPWWDLESRRIVLMNTMELRDWALLPNDQQVPMGGTEIAGAPQYHVDSPVRIACYCRHQHEKIGYRIIYTIKNYMGEFVAQGITAILTVTDDHKAEREKAKVEAAAAIQANVKQVPSTPQPEAKRRKRSGDGLASPENSYIHSGSSTPGASVSLPQGLQFQIPTPMSSLQFGHVSGFPMLNQVNHIIQNSQPSRMAQINPHTLSSLNNSMNAVMSMPSNISHAPPSQMQFIPQSFQFDAAMFAPQNTVRPPAPNTFVVNGMLDQNSAGMIAGSQVNQLQTQHQQQHITTQQQQQQFSALNQLPNSSLQNPVLQNSMFTASNTPPSMPSLPQYHRPQPPQPQAHVQNVIPCEGPVTGGIPVCVLGCNFTLETEVFFGTVLAPIQKFMSDTCMVVTLPANKPGSVPVYTTMPNNPQELKSFRYIDHNEKMLMELALNVLGSKVAGGKFSASDLARMIIGNGIDLRASSQMGDGGNRQQLERNLLRVLDLIDQDDSPYPARLDLADKQTGQRMLHLASALGMQSFVSALLARGADPNNRDKNGNTSLHFASLFGYPDIVKRLLARHAEPSYNNKSGLTAGNLATSESVKMEFRRFALESRSRHHSRSNSVSSNRFSRRSSIDVSPIVDDVSSIDEDDLNHQPEFYEEPVFGRRTRSSSAADQSDDMTRPRPVTRQPTFFQQLSQPNWQMFSNGIQNMRNIRGNLPALAGNMPGMPGAPTYQQLLEYFNRNVVENIPGAPGLQNYQGFWHRFQRGQGVPDQNETAGDDDAPPSYDEVVNPGEVLSDDTKSALDTIAITREIDGGISTALVDVPTVGGAEEGSSSKTYALSSLSTGFELTKKPSHDEIILRRGDRQITVIGKTKKMDKMRRMVDETTGNVILEPVAGPTDKMLYMFWIPMLILILGAMAWNVSQTRQDEIKFIYSLVRGGVVKVAEFVQERVREEQNGRMNRGEGQWI